MLSLKHFILFYDIKSEKLYFLRKESIFQGKQHILIEPFMEILIQIPDEFNL